VKTTWARELSDPGRPEQREIPLIGQVASSMAILGQGPPQPAAATGHGPGASEPVRPRPAIA
jgi:hypothetical protein